MREKEEVGKSDSLSDEMVRLGSENDSMAGM